MGQRLHLPWFSSSGSAGRGPAGVSGVQGVCSWSNWTDGPPGLQTGVLNKGTTRSGADSHTRGEVTSCALQGAPGRPLPALGAPAPPGPWPHHPGLCLRRHMAPALSLMRTLVIRFRATPDNPKRTHPETPNHTCKVYFPKKFPSVGSGVRMGTCLLGDTNPLLAGLVSLGDKHTQVRHPCCHTPPGVPDTRMSPGGGP